MVYSLEGDHVNAGLSFAGAMPFAGWVATGAKAGRKADDVPASKACSFTGDTRVLMADGTTKPAKDIEVGDQVRATDPEIGESGARTVIAVWIHQETVLDLVMAGGATVTTTEDHPCWNATDHQWQQAQHLDPGDQLHTATGRAIAVDRLRLPSAHVATAYIFTVDDLHTYYVLAGNMSV